MRLKHSIPLCLFVMILTVSSLSAQGRDEDEILIKTQKLNASIVRSKSRMRGSMRLRFGLPRHDIDRSNCVNVLSDVDGSEKISCGGAYWQSENMDTRFPNWVGWNIAVRKSATSTALDAPVLDGAALWRDYFTDKMPKGRFNVNPHTWNAIMAEAAVWAEEAPTGYASIVCGPILSSLDDLSPKAYFVVLCKRTGTNLGYKSIAFLLPNNPSKAAPIYNYSMSVNIMERLTGYNFFPELPSEVQEMVENMTTYELFCSYQEQRDYQEGPELPDNGYEEIMYDLMEDMRR